MQAILKQFIIGLNVIFFPLIRRFWWLWRRNRRGVQVIVRHGNEVLLVKHSYGVDAWALPGGGIKRSETPAEAAHREIYEELRLSLRTVHFAGDFAPRGAHSRGRIWVFVAPVTQPRVSLDHSYELRDAKWFPLGRLPDNRFSLVEKCFTIANIHS